MKREFTGVFIPAHIWTSKELIPAEKMILGEIDALSKTRGYCDASRAHFAEWLGCTVQNVTYYFEKLQRLGFISVEKIPGYRSKIALIQSRFYDAQGVNGTDGGGKSGLLVGVNGTDGGGKRDLPEIKDKVKKEIKNMSGLPDGTEILPLEEKKKKEKVHPAAALEKKIEALREKLKTAAEPERAKIIKEGKSLKEKLETEKQIDAVILRLNEKAGFQYQLTTVEARKVICKRLSDNSLEEIFQVIDFKVREWKDKEEMRQYLRPATLLNGHFEDYYQASLLKPKTKNQNEAVYTPPAKRFVQ